MGAADRKHIAEIDWLAHRWPVDTRPFGFGGGTRWTVVIGGHERASFPTREEALAAGAAIRPCCLAGIIARHPDKHPTEVLILENSVRIGRIRPELWGSYDGVELGVTAFGTITVLSAKVCALFPDHPKALIHIMQRGASLIPPRKRDRGH